LAAVPKGTFLEWEGTGMIIDCHTHILYTGADPGARTFMKEMCVSYFQSVGKLPTDREVTDGDWKELDFLFQPVLPEVSIAEHDAVGVDKIVILAVAPSNYTHYLDRGLWDPTNVTKLPEPHTLDQVNDRIAALVRMHPDKFIGFAAVNPRYKGVRWAVAELERAIEKLGLTGLKLYPGYDHYSPDDRDLAWPVFAKAQELGIPVMVHQASSTVSEFKMAYGRPYLLDDVGMEFPDLHLLVCHVGVPWTDECISLVTKHPNFYMDVSFFNSLTTRQEMFTFLHKCKRWGLPLSKVCWGTDYPCFEALDTLMWKFKTMNEEADEAGLPPISDAEMSGMLGENYLRFLGS
jgi:predicted TIM-barrel fold metal-dependent hydrolase